MAGLPPLSGLPAGLRSRYVEPINGLTMHVLEAGFETPDRPLVLLLHGFPELAYSWRKVMPALAAAGYHVVAPDQRGYGRTTGADTRYEASIGQFGLLSLVRDALALVAALGRSEVAAVIGHDFGSPVAAHCALIRPDVFRAVALMSAPFAGPPALPPPAAGPDLLKALAALDPPRKLYQWYYSSPEAGADMRGCAQGLSDFLRAYYHVKSADWAGNAPFRLAGWAAEDLARMPTYYVMALDQDMAATVAPHGPSKAEVAACGWLPDAELAVYVSEFARTGFQGGLNWYRCGTSGLNARETALFSGRRIEVPALFVAGAQDWGVYQAPGALEAMQAEACADFRGRHLIQGAGHWVQQEQPGAVGERLLEFLVSSQP
ncbi:alpha/beta hydrolase [Phenylobacterium sp.]|jgi:pimeloyl-ACP methyl ester carboxylesterase|uniref:alpha/beta hydrolase n=1 Tax=Phenylobacterium sp. TaxID=1871053 RepID=UPI002F3F2FBF